MLTRPDSFATASISSASATLVAMGFSQRTCMPFFKAAIEIRACVESTDTTDTPSSLSALKSAS
jgi:hypothetical protein